MRQKLLVSFVLLFALASSVAAFFFFRETYARDIAQALAGKLLCVSFKPHVDREPVTITDVTQISKIHGAILAGNPVPIGSYPATTCSLTFNFEDGKTETLQISPTGITSRNFFNQEPKTFHGLSYVMIKWRGYFRRCDSQPFLEALREQHLISKDDNERRADL